MSDSDEYMSDSDEDMSDKKESQEKEEEKDSDEEMLDPKSTSMVMRSEWLTDAIWPSTTMDNIAQKLCSDNSITTEDAMVMLGVRGPIIAPWMRNPKNMRICSIARPGQNAGISRKDANVIQGMVNNAAVFLYEMGQIASTGAGAKDVGTGQIGPMGEMSMGWSRNGLNFFFDGKFHLVEDWTMGVIPASSRINFNVGQWSIFNLPIYANTGTIVGAWQWLPDYSEMSVDDLLGINNGEAMRGHMYMKWPKKLIGMLSGDGEMLRVYLQKELGSLVWSRRRAGGKKKNRYEMYARDSFSNANLSDGFGRIYHMICIFNHNDFWNDETIARINFGFLIYHIMLTIMGQFAEASSSNVKLKHGSWGVSTKAISDQICNSMWDIRSLGRLKGVLPPAAKGGSGFGGKEVTKFMDVREHLFEKFRASSDAKLDRPFKVTADTAVDRPDAPLLCVSIWSHGEMVMMTEGVTRVLNNGICNSKRVMDAFTSVKVLPTEDPSSEGRPIAAFLFNCKPNEQPINAKGDYGNQYQLFQSYEYIVAKGVGNVIMKRETQATLKSIQSMSVQSTKSGDTSAGLRRSRYFGTIMPDVHNTEVSTRAAVRARKNTIFGMPKYDEASADMALGKLTNAWFANERDTKTWNLLKKKLIDKMGPTILTGYREYTWSDGSTRRLTIKEMLENNIVEPGKTKGLSPLEKLQHIYQNITTIQQGEFAGLDDDNTSDNLIKLTTPPSKKKEGGRRKKTKKRRKKKKKKKTKKTKRVKRKKTRKKKKRRRKSRKNKLK